MSKHKHTRPLGALRTTVGAAITLAVAPYDGAVAALFAVLLVALVVAVRYAARADEARCEARRRKELAHAVSAVMRAVPVSSR